MAELGLPFEEVQIAGIAVPSTGRKRLPITGSMQPMFPDPPPDAKPWPHKFFTLRVCKMCRGHWMQSIAAWFREAPEPESDDLEAGAIYVREFGATVRISREEWDRRNPGRESAVGGKSDA